MAVEKNGGCNHMTCRQCGYEWCWMCAKIWKGHDDFYACARYEVRPTSLPRMQIVHTGQKASKRRKDKGKKGKKAKLQAQEEEREQKRMALERYLSYYQKFLEFDALVKRSGEYLDKAQQKMEALQSDFSTLAEVKFIEKAALVLAECHCVLRNSYVSSYFFGASPSSLHARLLTGSRRRGEHREATLPFPARRAREDDSDAGELLGGAQHYSAPYRGGRPERARPDQGQEPAVRHRARAQRRIAVL